MKTINLKKTSSKKTIEEAIRVLSAGGLVIYPTETCYGIGADAENKKAIKKLLEYKSRREGKPFSIVVSDQKMAEKYVKINQVAQNFYDQFLPGPITVISKSKGKVAPGVESEQKTLGIRIPAYPLILELVKQFGRPITATSANVSYAKRPYSLSQWKKYTPQKNQKLVDLFLDGGKLPPNPPSTVVDTTLEDFEILRKGEIDFSSPKEETVVTESELETQRLGQKLMEKDRKDLSQKCLIFSLQGELGTGKTQLTKGIAKGLGIKETIVSPTFTIVREYLHPKGKLHHIDTWRLFSEEEIEDLRIEKTIKRGNVIVIEWAEKAEPIISQLAKSKLVKLIRVRLKHLDLEKRKIIFPR